MTLEALNSTYRLVSALSHKLCDIKHITDCSSAFLSWKQQ